MGEVHKLVTFLDTCACLFLPCLLYHEGIATLPDKNWLFYDRKKKKKLDYYLGDMKENEKAKSNLIFKMPFTSQPELFGYMRMSRVVEIRLRSVRLYQKKFFRLQ